ncbi:glutathione S-transferase Mu 4-like [Peromyscus eremicus]|uniref:glutathione S-transferase Mu 4-like n=1 Tax=Peromyscus eremicus TaxID=42410 RepID=UPI0027DC0E0C|nr:glutathione S-transferase Mu 4-like [Peromyscus eremicus]
MQISTLLQLTSPTIVPHLVALIGRWDHIAPDYDRTQWLSEKFKLHILSDYPCLPYLIDGSNKFIQSDSILPYLACKHNLCGRKEKVSVVDILENQGMDVSNQLVRVDYSPDFKKLKAKCLELLPRMIKLFLWFLGKQTWFVGEKITFVDFFAYDILNQHFIFKFKCLDAFPNLKDFVAHFEGLKTISAYMKTSASSKYFCIQGCPCEQ